MAITTCTTYAELEAWRAARNAQGSYTEDEWAEIPASTSITVTADFDLNPVNAGAYTVGIRVQSNVLMTGALWPSYGGTRVTITLGDYANFSIRGTANVRCRGMQLTRGTALAGAFFVGNGAKYEFCIGDAGPLAGTKLAGTFSGGGEWVMSLLIASASSAHAAEAGDPLTLKRCTVVANGRTGTAFRSDYGYLQLIGTAVYGFSGGDLTGTLAAGSTHNATSNGTALGTSGQTGLLLADFTSSTDYRRASDSTKLGNVGTAISGVTTDFYGTSLPQGAANDIGAFELPEVSGPTITTQPQPTTVNEPAAAAFSVSATASGGSLTYQWQRANPGSGTFSPVSGATSATINVTPTSAAADNGAQYRVVVSDANGSTTSSAAPLTVRSTTTTTRPSADVSAAGWTPSSGAVLFDMIDEAVASDADFITSPAITATPVPAVMALQYPLATGTWNIGIRVRSTGANATVRVKLLDAAGTTVGTSADQVITSTYTTYTLQIVTTAPAARVSVEAVT